MKIRQINESKLNEETLETAVKKAAIDKELHDPNQLEYVLDRALNANLAKKMREAKGVNPGGFINVLITGSAGIGKTARVEQWARERGLNLVQEDAKGMDPSDIGGAISPDKEKGTRAIKLGTTQFDDLENGGEKLPFSVLFLDEFNRADPTVRGSLLTLINNHRIPDPEAPGHSRYLKNMLFTVVAINPSTDGNYNTDLLDIAELSRFLIVDMKPNKFDILKHLRSKYEKELQVEDDPDEQLAIQGRLALAEKILSSSEFQFDDAEDEKNAMANQRNVLNYRSFTQCLDMSDGTKDDFLDWWDGFCNPEKKSVVKMILANYKDVENKANSVFKKDVKKTTTDSGEEVEETEVEEEEPETASIFKNKKVDDTDILGKFSDWNKSH